MKILFIGCGRMGSAILTFLLDQNILSKKQITIVKPTKNNNFTDIDHYNNFSKLPTSYKADIVFFAFKPQTAEKIITDFKRSNKVNSECLYISILAGKKIGFFKKILGKDANIIRIMPNLPILVSKGSFPYFHQINLFTESLKEKLSLFENLPLAFKAKNEKQLDIITVISGSGPAYLFLFAKIIIDNAINMGLDKEVSEKLVKNMLEGSSLMLNQTSKKTDQLIDSVCSKGGVTKCAIDILKEDDILFNIMQKAINSAYTRLKELENE